MITKIMKSTWKSEIIIWRYNMFLLYASSRSNIALKTRLVKP